MKRTTNATSTYVETTNRIDVNDHFATHNHRLSLYCPHCKSIVNDKPINLSYDYSINISTEDDSLNASTIINDIIPAMAVGFPRVAVHCPECDRITNVMAVDYEIGDIIARLNNLSLKTVFSCAGHSHYQPYIAFESEFVTDRIDIDKLPHWYWDFEGIVTKSPFGVVMRVDMNSITLNEYREQIYLDELREYLDELEAE